MPTHNGIAKTGIVAAFCLLLGCDGSQVSGQKLPSSLMLVATNSENDDTSCFSACKNYSGSPYCLPTGYDPKNSAQLADLASKLTNESVPIPATWLKSNFQISEDPCGRSDTKFLNGSWVNEGFACILSSKITLPSNAPVSVRIDIPATLRAERSTKDGYRVYTSKDNAILLSFLDPNWHNDWGGEIRYVAVNNEQAMFQVNRGCISVGLKP